MIGGVAVEDKKSLPTTLGGAIAGYTMGSEFETPFDGWGLGRRGR